MMFTFYQPSNVGGDQVFDIPFSASWNGDLSGRSANVLYDEFVRNSDNIIYVSSLGNNATATKGNIRFPFLTPDAAVSAAVAGDTICFLSGSYTLTGNLFKNNVKYVSLGVVIITKTAEGNFFDYTGATSDIFISGNFHFIKSTTAGKIFYSNNSPNITVHIDIWKANSSTDKVFDLQSSNAVTANVSGEFTSTADIAINLFGLNNGSYIFYGNTTSTAADAFVATGMSGSTVYKHDLTTSSVSNAIQCSLSQTNLPNSFLVFDDLIGNLDYYGGSCIVYGNIRGTVTSQSDGISVNDGSNTLVLHGIVSGTITNTDNSVTILHGSANRIICSGGKVYVLGSLFSKQVSYDFNVTGGELHFNNRSNIDSAVTSTIDGGKVYFDGQTIINSFLNDQQKYIRLISGTLIVRGLIHNKQLSSVASGKPYLIKHEGGTLVFDGARLINDEPDSSPVICTAAEDVKILRVSSNQDFMTSKKLKVLVTITAAVDAYTYSFGAANYVAGPTDTTTDIATALVAAITDVLAAPVDNLDGTFTVEAVTAGVAFTSAISAAGMTLLIQRNNHLAPTDLIAGTPTNTRYLIDAAITE